MNPRPVGIGFGSGRKPPNSAKMRSRWPPPAEATSSVASTATAATTRTRTTCEILTSAPATSTTTTNSASRATSSRTATRTATANTRIQTHNRNYWSNPRSQLSTIAVLLLAIVALNNLDTFLAPAAASLARGQSQSGESPIYSIYSYNIFLFIPFKNIYKVIRVYSRRSILYGNLLILSMIIKTEIVVIICVFIPFKNIYSLFFLLQIIYIYITYIV